MPKSIIVDWSNVFEKYDLREEIAEWERRHRPFPPRSGSVSKPWTFRPDDPYLWPCQWFSDEFIASWEAEQSYKYAPRWRAKVLPGIKFREIAAEHAQI